jgi:hypothetical protein
MRLLALFLPLCLLGQSSWTRLDLPFTLQAGETERNHLPGTMPGGLAVFDYDGDGQLDLFLTNGAPLPGRLKQAPRDCHALLRNLGGWKFENVTQQAGLCGEGYAIGATAADYDNDGRPDLLVLGVGVLHLYRNLGEGKFEDVTARAKLANAGRWGIAGSFADIDRDGDLDLLIVNYVAWDPSNEPECKHAGVRDYCHPRYFKPTVNVLFENVGNGTFRDISESSGIAKHPSKAMSVATADYNGDGLPDFFVTNDRIFNHLLLSKGNRKYEESSFEWGVAAPPDGSSPSAMGAFAEDYDNDGRTDLIYTALDDETFPLYRNTGTIFDDVGTATKLALLTRPMAGWGLWFADADNDGWADLFVARGGVLSPAGPRGAANLETLALFRNLNGKSFREVGAEVGFNAVKKERHRGLVAADLNNDGCVDAVVTTLNAPAFVMRNPCASVGNWIGVRLQGKASNGGGLGARVKATTPAGAQYRNVQANGGYASSLLGPLHFGLGSAKAATLEVTWPSGRKQTVEGLEAGRVHTITETN